MLRGKDLCLPERLYAPPLNRTRWTFEQCFLHAQTTMWIEKERECACHVKHGSIRKTRFHNLPVSTAPCLVKGTPCPYFLSKVLTISTGLHTYLNSTR